MYRTDMIVKADEDFARGQPLVYVPEDWAQEMKAARNAGWQENHGNAYGEAAIEAGSEIERQAQTAWLAGGGAGLSWIQGHSGTIVGFIERRDNGRFVFCG